MKMRRIKTKPAVFIAFAFTTVVMCCEPAKEGSRYVMSAFVSPQDLNKDFLWKRNGTFIAHCKTSITCESSFSHLYNISMNFVSTGHYNISLTILNVIRGFPVFAVDRWTMVSETEPVTIYFSCNLQVFASVLNPTCNFTHSSRGLNVSCFVQRVYPAAACDLELYVDKKPYFTVTNVTTISIRWSTTEPVYYNTSCSVHVPYTNLRPGLQKLHVSVYPNVTNPYADKKYGKTVVHNITLEPPAVEIKVTNYTDASGRKTFNCTCYRTDSSQIETTIQWYRNNTMIQHNNGAITAMFEASGPKDEYYCQAINIFGWTSQNVSCIPVEEEYITTAQSVQNCSANSSSLVEDVGEMYNITPSSNNTVSSNSSGHEIKTEEPSGYITVLVVFSAVLVIAVVLAAIFWKTIYPRIYHTTKIHKNEYELKGNDTDGLDTTWCLGEEDTESHYEELDKFRS